VCGIWRSARLFFLCFSLRDRLPRLVVFFCVSLLADGESA
jgi:hypothetical protein